MKKKILISIVLGILIIAGFYFNFFLQRDFLIELGFGTVLAIVGVLFLDSGKVICEILFFKLNMTLAKKVIGVFALVLIALSTYATFSVRLWKSANNNAIVESKNQAVTDNLDRFKRQRQRLDNQLISVERQIQTKQSMIMNTDSVTGRWIIWKYNKQITKLNKEKNLLISKLNQIEKTTPKAAKKIVSMTAALSQKLGSNSENIETWINLIIALTIESLILLFNYSLTLTWKDKKLNSLVGEQQKGVKVGSILQKSYSVSVSIDNGKELKEHREKYNLTQEDVAKMTGIHRRKISRMEGSEKIFEDELNLVHNAS